MIANAKSIKVIPTTEREAKWYAIYTNYKSEKQVTMHLQRKNIEAYIPLVSKTRKYQKRLKKYQVPLINCYVFVKIKSNEHIKVLETEHVLKFITQGKMMQSIPQYEIDILKKIEGYDLEILAKPYEFSVGDEVEIAKGSLVGMRGRLIKQQGKKTFVVQLESVGIDLHINIDSNMLAKVNDRGLIA